MGSIILVTELKKKSFLTSYFYVYPTYFYYVKYYNLFLLRKVLFPYEFQNTTLDINRIKGLVFEGLTPKVPDPYRNESFLIKVLQTGGPEFPVAPSHSRKVH